MTIPHAQPGEMIDIRTLGSRINERVTSTLAKAEALELLRLVIPAKTQIA